MDRKERKPFISILCSMRNEEDCIDSFIKSVRSIIEPISKKLEFIFINDDSTDRSLEILSCLAKTDPAIKVVTTTRRFGVDECLILGMDYCQGDVVVPLQADLQDPVECVPDMLDLWRDGADVVYGVRTARPGEGRLNMWIKRRCYECINIMSEVYMPVESGDFMILDRRVVETMRKFPEKDPYFRGLVRLSGFKQVPFLYVRNPRVSGTSKVVPLSLREVAYFIFALTSCTFIPVYVVGVFSVFLMAAGLISLFFASFSVSLVLSLSGLQMFFMAVIGVYVTRIYKDVRGRPRVLVKETVNV